MISICIPTKNAGPDFGRTLELWRAQQTEEEIELVLVDSGSSDDTVAQVRAAGARVEAIRPEEFNHGDTRNLLASLARGDILVFTVQDARPANTHVLAELCGPLRADSALAGVSGLQVPDPGADIVGRMEVERLGRALDKGLRCKRLASWEEFLSWDFPRRFECAAFDNVCSALRRRAWEQFPFVRTDFGEDLEWSLRIQRSGGAVAHNPAARVFHSHRQAPSAWLRRYFLGRRRTCHTLALPPEHSNLTDEQAFRAAREFDVWVAAAYDGQPRRSLLPRMWSLYDSLFPETVRRPLRRLGLRGTRYIVQALPPAQLWLTLKYLWREVQQSSGPVPPGQRLYVARQLEGLVLGDFLGSYYHTCEVQQRVSPWLRRVGQGLAGDETNGRAPEVEADGLGRFLNWAASPAAAEPPAARDSGR